MMPDPIPGWTSEGVLPPVHPDALPTARERSPYRVSLIDLVLRYAMSTERNAILQGFLSFRKALNDVGLDQGFQWVDGSFAENIELIGVRPPNDIDVVTFCYVPDKQGQEEMVHRAPRLFVHAHIKEDYRVDSQFVQLNGRMPESLVDDATYWYSLWSHNRTGQWKGYVQLDLSSADDQITQAYLDKAVNQGGQE